ncbi:MAG: hypothetical protein FWE71_09845 [Nocardioidaceae bacterium]|nr:hypothetical protein [Nocardioidaceae bacterium]MCL2611929.1 hypothetical protein [Nocardioidaceae bacterium]
MFEEPTQIDYRVLVHRDEDGSLWAEVEQLPGLFVTGETTEELTEALAEAIELYLSTPESSVAVRVDRMREESRTLDARVRLAPA